MMFIRKVCEKEKCASKQKGKFMDQYLEMFVVNYRRSLYTYPLPPGPLTQ